MDLQNINENLNHMNSPFGNKEMQLKSELRTFRFRNEDFEIMYHFYYDSDLAEEVTDLNLEEINQAQVYNKYRAKHRLPFTN